MCSEDVVMRACGNVTVTLRYVPGILNLQIPKKREWSMNQKLFLVFEKLGPLGDGEQNISWGWPDAYMYFNFDYIWNWCSH